ncbi:MAG: hypothetical protein WB791_08045 [Waddliaceae bacterium]
MTKHMLKKFMILFAFTLSIGMASCYRMPGDDDYSVVPTTNNPAVIGNSGNQPSLMPGGGF